MTELGKALAEPKLYAGAVIVFWSYFSRKPKPEPAIVITVFEDGTFSSLGLYESGTYGRGHAPVSAYSAEPKSGHWCWPAESVQVAP